jgi:hypothetical protein
MASDDKIELAKRLYVEQGRTIPDIAVSLDVAIFVLNAASAREDWAGLRQSYQAQRKEVDPNDTLSQHETKIRKQFLLIDELLVRLEDKSLQRSERMDIKDQIEAIKWATEALSMMVDLDRKVHGIKNSAPSVSPGADQEQGVKYVVKIASEAKKAVNG